MLDKVAEEQKIEAALTESWFSVMVKTPFQAENGHHYYAFSATENQKLMVDCILGKELDFEELTANGIIVDHFPLHKRKLIDKM